MYGQIVSVGKKQAITVDNFMDKYCDLLLVKKTTLGTESVSIFPYNIDDAFFVPYGNELCCYSLSSGVSQHRHLHKLAQTLYTLTKISTGYLGQPL